MKSKFLKRGDSYLYFTGKSPKGFKDVLFIIWSGIPAIESVEPVDKLKSACEVSPEDIPDDIYEAFVEAGLCKPRAAHFEEHFEKFQDHIAAGLDIPTACAASGFMWESKKHKSNTDLRCLLFIIGIILVIIFS